MLIAAPSVVFNRSYWIGALIQDVSSCNPVDAQHLVHESWVFLVLEFAPEVA
jgi:hypothetical protein